ncbi:MAG: hypothetical protein IJI46_07390 [Erysipelotrichaceae bacterium]|nr:hypothetical protein [Erysipelotrichaceae bacterium]
MKKYIYQKKYYQFKVVYIGYFTAAIALFSLYQFIISRSALSGLVLLICLYQLINTFVSISNPEEIDIDDKSITFKAFNKEHKYLFKDILDFRVKDFPLAKKIYLRINKDTSGLLKGRYWIDCSYFNDGDELFSYLIAKEDEMHPDTIRAYAHRSNAEANKKEKKQ